MSDRPPIESQVTIPDRHKSKAATVCVDRVRSPRHKLPMWRIPAGSIQQLPLFESGGAAK